MDPVTETPPGSRFTCGDVVILRETLEQGQVVDPPTLSGGEYWYRIRFGRRSLNLPEDQLDLPDDGFRDLQRLVQAGRWGKIEAFRCALALERILNVNETTVYAYKAQRILFEPYQYKPLLKLLASTDRKLLIADEVGLGKTIEAGLILTELEARQPIDKVLVICPSRLRSKWFEELNRKFNQDFSIFNAATLRDYLRRALDNPAKSHLRGIVSIETLRDARLRQSFDELGALDIVIIDEAHYGRNPQTQAAQTVRDMSQLGSCTLLLTATPLQLKTRDLFTLVNALRPAEFRDPRVFEMMIERFAAIHVATSLVRTAKPENLARAASQIRLAFAGETEDPLVNHVIRDLHSPPPDRRGWIDLGRRLEELHPLSTILTRTRKRDVQSTAPTRHSFVYKCKWTVEEAAAYNAFVGIAGNGWAARRLTMGQIQRARQAASSIHAAILYSRTTLAGKSRTADEYPELSDILPSEDDSIEDDDAPAPPRLPPRDSKLEALLEHLGGVLRTDPGAKVLIFTFFVGTARYLSENIEAAGHTCTSISGQVKSNPRVPDKDDRGMRIRQFRDDPELRVMVSTEVGSEGLDFQFCHHLINYDLPWNPMVVEQRIGRIDRFGQKSTVVQIHNLVVEDTIEDLILFRLYERIGIFKKSIGDLETILGETVSELQRDYLAGKLTPDEAEARVIAAANAIEGRKRDMEVLEQEASQLFGHEASVREEMQRIGTHGRYLAENALLSILRIYLQSHHPKVKIVADGDDIFSLGLSEQLAHDIRVTCNVGESWTPPKDGRRMSFTMNGSVAFDNTDVELINAAHPFLRAAVHALKDRLTAPEALVGHGTIEIRPDDNVDIAEGVYVIVVAAHLVGGVRSRRELDPVVWSLERSDIVDADAGERLLHIVAERAQEWFSAAPASAISEPTWNLIWDEFRRRSQRLRTQAEEENVARYERRKQLLQAEYDRLRGEIEARLYTARSRKSDSRGVNLFEAQLSRKEKQHRDRLSELEKVRLATVSLSDAIAACLISVRRPDRRKGGR